MTINNIKNKKSNLITKKKSESENKKLQDTPKKINPPQTKKKFDEDINLDTDS